MASNDLTSMEDLITCSFCSKLYDDPRLLPCLHSYCFRCINSIISNNKNHFICPICGENETTQIDINSLPSNVIIHDIIELYASMKHSPMCSNCESSEADSICNKCQKYYCSSCYDETHSARVFQDHSKMSMDTKFSEIPFCQKHSDEKLKYWCQDCHTSVCSDCCLTEHKNHLYNLINKLSKELETKVGSDFEMIQSSLNNEMKKIDTFLNIINIKSQRNKTEVKKIMTFLRQIIDEHEKQLLQDIENFQREEIQQIEEYKIILENQLRFFDLQNQALDLFISTNDQIRLLKNKFNFSNYIKQINEILEQLQIPMGIDYQINGLEQLYNLKEQIFQCRIITENSKQIIPLLLDERIQIDTLIARYRYQTSQEIDFSRQSLTDQNIYLIFEILKKTNKMITLNLSNNQIGPEGIENLVDILQNNKILTTLDLTNNEIIDDGTKYLADYLKTNTTLKTLYLCGNGISEIGTQYLTNVLKDNNILTVLALQSNRIGCCGAQYIADALRKNNTLTTLYLSDNQIGNQGVQYLADAIQKNTTLTGLTLSDNEIDHEAKRRAIEKFKTKKRLAVYW